MAAMSDPAGSSRPAGAALRSSGSLPDGTGTWSRREFLAGAGACATHLAVSLAAGTATARRAFAARQMGEVVRDEPFARLERLADGVWAVVSKPLEGRQTLSNGGLVAGTEGVLAVEGLNTVEGAHWLIDAAVQLTGRRPTHVVLTHYHGDHSRGLPGYRSDAGTPLAYSTVETRRLLEENGGGSGLGDDPLTLLSDEAMVPDTGEPVEIDLGGRVVRVAHRHGHTPSDLSIEVVDPRVVFCGDLVWNNMFPNYVDAIPSQLWRSCSDMLADPEAIYVPGHGAVADRDGLEPYLGLLADVARAAQMAYDEGFELLEAADAYRMPRALRDWHLFSDSYFEVAFRAWYRELSGGELG